MNFLHSRVQVGPGQAVLVELDHAANVKVMDDPNFDRYRRGTQHQYFGGHATQSPVAIRPPRPGQWHVIVDLGGYPGQVRAGISVQ
ncbi:MAG: DUF1883 domain-containing protein [Chloroflexota bacterium]